MIQPKYKSFLFSCIAILLTISAWSQTTNTYRPKIQSSAVPFMLISPDARAGGMGNLSLGMTQDDNDLFGNTA
jgi:hypothetical protein